MDQIIPYCGPAPTLRTLLGAWNVAPLSVLLTLAPLVAAILVPGVRRGPAVLVGAGLFIAFISPLCALTVALFAARGVHHLVLLLAAAPALAMAWPRVLPVGRTVGFLAVSVFLWLWHLPAAYTLAWNSPFIYWLMQAGLLGSAWAFWSQVLHGEQPEDRIVSSGTVLALAGEMGLLGAILTFAPQILYPQHVALAGSFGLDALADQQLAGLIMWVPGMLPLALIAGLMLWRGWREVALP